MKRLMYSIALAGALAAGCTKAVIEESPTVNIDGPVTYNTHVRPIMNNWCTTCHGGAAPSAGLSLTNYNQVRVQTEFGNLVERVNSTTNPMPPNGNLTAYDLAVINQWVTDGFPQ